jgi:uncharacterized membrane protein YhhN
MQTPFLLLALALAALDWLAVEKGWKRLEYIAKPGVMVALLASLWQAGGGAAALSGPLGWFAAGILLSLAGDVFLMLPRERFVAGLAAFLLAHLAYLAGFNPTPPPLNLASGILALLVALVGMQLYRRIAAGLDASGHPGLKAPVQVYSITISLMLLAALLTLVRQEWEPGPALLAGGGALLFFISDLTLAWNKFVAPLPAGRLRVHVTYHLGQALIVLGAAAHFLS